MQAVSARNLSFRAQSLRSTLNGTSQLTACRIDGRHTRRRPRHVCRVKNEAEKQEASEQQTTPAAAQTPPNGSSPAAATPAPSDAAAAAASNGTSGSASAAQQVDSQIPELVYQEPSSAEKFWTSAKLALALPWRRFKQDSVLVIKLEGSIAEQPQPRFSSSLALPTICDCLLKAAYDPRVTGVVVKIDPLAAGWGKLQEIRRHVEVFNASGKMSIAYMERAGEKEYYLASAFKELYIPPSGYLALRGFTVGGTFLRGVLDKVGVEPEVKRIGKFKSAGDQLLRRDMSEAQREQLGALVDDIYQDFVQSVARSRGKTEQEVRDMLDAGIFDTEQYKQQGWITDLKYEDEINEMLKPKTGGKEDQVAKVGLKKYASVRTSTFAGLSGSKAVAVIRTAGAIVGGKGASGTISAPSVIAQLRRAKKDKKIAAVVLRVDSGGGDALASDLMWREICQLAEKKPVVASMSDVAASGGYYMSMGARKVVAEALTITGSIGVVTGKFNLQELYQKVGYNKELISRGRFAEVLADSRRQSEEEEALFAANAQYAYESFRDKAAESRGMEKEAMQEVAQGRIWSGQRAVQLGLIDAVGGLRRALAIAKKEAGIEEGEGVRLVEYSRAKPSPLALLSAGGASASANPLVALGALLLQSLAGGGGSGSFSAAAATSLGAPALLGAVLTQQQAAGGLGPALGMAAGGAVQAVLPEGVSVEGVGSAALLAQAQAQAGGGVGAGSWVWGPGAPRGEEEGGLFE